MFKAINKTTLSSIIILDEKWDARIDELRLMAHQDLLVCQECNQPVRVRAGGENAFGREKKRIIRRHFAHKHKQNCSYQSESYKLLAARVSLYNFLKRKFKDNVTIEKKNDDPRFFRPFDCWVDFNGHSFAYWIFDQGLKAQKREGLLAAVKESNFVVNWIFDGSILNNDVEDRNIVNLSTTERTFQSPSKFNITSDYHQLGKTLHFLDSNDDKMVSFRSLQLQHEPQQHYGLRKESLLTDLMVSPSSGEFVHPGESEVLKEYALIQDERMKLRESQRGESLSLPRACDLLVQIPAADVSERYSSPPKPQTTGRANNIPLEKENRQLKCMICGELVDTWWMEDTAIEMCKCYNCYGKR